MIEMEKNADLQDLPWKRKMIAPMKQASFPMQYAGGDIHMKTTVREGIPMLHFPAFLERPEILHGFSTRFGGVSTGNCASLNFSVKTFDSPANVNENYRRFALAMGVSPEGLVISHQTHTTNVRVVTAEDAGKGYSRDRDYENIDGLITNVPGITLVTHYADCVPLFFFDPVHKAIGLSHSGWRGTVGQIGRETLRKMSDCYGTDPGDVICAIGPCICRDCYEVSEDVAEEFRKLLNCLSRNGLLVDGRTPSEEMIFDNKGNGKYQLDLWMANRLILLNAGILPEHLSVTDICTCCNPTLLHSHRATKGERGTLGAFLSLV